MSIFYAISFGVIAIIIYALCKSAIVTKKPIHDLSNVKEKVEASIEVPNAMPKEIGKNRWLHPTDEFGIMEQGVTNGKTRSVIFQ